MTQIQASGASAPAPTPAKPLPVIRLDPSKPKSTVHGDRTPEDPHYRVHFWQGGLPFDVNGVLVPDDGKVGPWIINGPDDKPIQARPLYDATARAAMERKIARLTKAVPAEPLPIDEHSDAEDRAAASEDVNFASWLRGEVQYEPFLLFAAAKKRYSKLYTKLSDLVIDLVLDEAVVPEDEVALQFKRWIPQSASS